MNLYLALSTTMILTANGANYQIEWTYSKHHVLYIREQSWSPSSRVYNSMIDEQLGRTPRFTRHHGKVRTLPNNY